jgi:hypothetical protein
MRGPRRILVVAGIAGAVLLVGEVGVRALEPALPEPEIWPDDATTVKVEQMDELDCADVVVVGNSVARDDLRPAVLDDELGVVAYNAALDAASARQVQRWLPDQVLPRLDPAAVVWIVTSPDLNDGAPAGQAAFDSYRSSPGGRDDLLGRLQRPLTEHVALVRNRAALTDPAALGRAVSDRFAGEDAPRVADDGLPGVLGPSGEGVSRQDLTYVEDDPVVAGFVRDQLLAEYEVGDHQLDAAAGAVDDLQHDGVEVVLVIPPVTEEFVALHPDGRDSFDEYRTAVSDLAAEQGVTLLDHSAEGDESWFADTHHLNGRGADEYTRQLAAELATVEGFPTATTCERGDP